MGGASRSAGGVGIQPLLARSQNRWLHTFRGTPGGACLFVPVTGVRHPQSGRRLQLSSVECLPNLAAHKVRACVLSLLASRSRPWLQRCGTGQLQPGLLATPALFRYRAAVSPLLRSGGLPDGPGGSPGGGPRRGRAARRGSKPGSRYGTCRPPRSCWGAAVRVWSLLARSEPGAVRLGSRPQIEAVRRASTGTGRTGLRGRSTRSASRSRPRPAPLRRLTGGTSRIPRCASPHRRRMSR
jgi:hypothetical protein